jgi:hypothetical protein
MKSETAGKRRQAGAKIYWGVEAFKSATVAVAQGQLRMVAGDGFKLQRQS